MEKELQQAIENANRLRRELPHLVQPSKSDKHMVLLHDNIKDLTTDLARLMAELERTQSECERLRKDAERYRWIRSSSVGPATVWHVCMEHLEGGLQTIKSDHCLDEAIDAAIAAEGEK